MDLIKIRNWLITIALLSFIIYLSGFVRSGTLNAKTILDYDPWWYYRHAIEIMNNGMVPPKWDILSYYPPGRPYDTQLGWVYTMIIFFKAISIFAKGISFLYVAKLSPLIMVGLGAIPAFLIGRLLSNKWGGLATALFALLAPTFIGVSMAGYTDNDPVVVFYTLLSAYSVMLALVKKKWPYYIFAAIVNIIFSVNWGGGWFVLMLFTAFIPMLFIFRLIEEMIHQRKLKIGISHIVSEAKSLLLPLVVIIVIANAVVYFVFGNLGMFGSFFVSLTFIKVSPSLLVNISVAELQSVNILSKEGFLTVGGRIGPAPFLFTIIGLPIFIFFKIYKKIKINFVEIFLFLWFLVTFYMILNGVRFSLSFAIASAVSAGYLIGNFFKYPKFALFISTAIVLIAEIFYGLVIFPVLLIMILIVAATLGKHFDERIYLVTSLGLTLFLIILFISDAVKMGYQSGGMEVSQNWIDSLDWLKQNADKNSLIVTWWDPGHIITGYTGLKVHADGAHCGPAECILYNHDIRIQDMGRIFSTSSEDEALTILKKYKSLTPEQCDKVKKTFGDKVPQNVCDPVADMYIIASNDLIGKYHWMSYFGTGTAKDFFQLPLTGVDQNQGVLSYADGVINLIRKGDQWVPVYNNKFVIKDIVYFENGQEKQLNFQNVTDSIDGLLWVDSSMQAVIFMEPDVRNSLFTSMYFWSGAGLKHFQLVFNNPELKIFKVVF